MLAAAPCAPRRGAARVLAPAASLRATPLRTAPPHAAPRRCARPPRHLPPRATAQPFDASTSASAATSAPASSASSSRFSVYSRVLVAGATGGTGAAVVAALLAEGVAVRALVRDPAAPAARALPPAVQLARGDVYDYASLPAALAGCDALICATGVRPALDPGGPFRVDFCGTANLASAAAAARTVKHFVLVTSIGTDDLLFPLNLAWGVLFWKKRGEEALQRSGLRYTIIRPGGLRSDGPTQPVTLRRGGTFGLPPRQWPAGSILRSQVGRLCVEALVAPAAANGVFEAVTDAAAPERPYSELFESAARGA